jgi:hypothetical protein
MALEKVEFSFPEGDEDEDGKNIIVVEDSSMTEPGAEPAPEPEAKKPEPKEEEGELEIEVVDDTPAADRNRKKSEAPEDVTDDELEHYSEKVANRIKHFSKGYHDERREKEAAIREKTELENLARTLMADNEKLKGNNSKSQSALFEQAKRQVAGDLASAKKAYKEAYDAGNGDELLKAQESLTTARIRADKLSQIKIPPLQQGKGDVQTQQQAPVAPPQQPPQQPLDPKVKSWAEENTWFGTDDEMTSFALGFHNKLVGKGVDPNTEDYYEQVNARMRQVFPDNFEDIDPVTQTRKPTNVVAPATRTVAPKKVKLTKTQVSIAKRLGVPLKLYAEQVAEEMRKGNG